MSIQLHLCYSIIGLLLIYSSVFCVLYSSLYTHGEVHTTLFGHILTTVYLYSYVGVCYLTTCLYK